MSLANSDQKGLTDAVEDPNTFRSALRFEGMENGCCCTIEEWIPKDGNKRTELEELRIPIEESDVSEWPKEPPQSTNLDGGLRLLVVENPAESYPAFPMKEDTLKRLLLKWDFPPLDELSHVLYTGGSAVFVSDDCTKINILIGGGVLSYSIGAILSYDCCSHITSGCIISGKHIAKWSKPIQHKFREVPNPFMIPVLMAEILIDKAQSMRGEVLKRIKIVEKEIKLVTPSMEPNGVETREHSRTRTEESTSRDYRSLNFELTEGYRFLGRFNTLVERIRLILEFVETSAEAGLDPSIFPIPKRLKTRVKLMQSSLKYMNVEVKNVSSRLESQIRVATSLVAQQDVALTHQTAMDSKEIAAATRRDGVAMKIIAGVGAVFLPGTIIAVRSISLRRPITYLLSQAFLALLPLNWGVGKTIWMYFVITIPSTFSVLGVVWATWRCLDKKLEAKTRSTSQGGKRTIAVANSERQESLQGSLPPGYSNGSEEIRKLNHSDLP